MAAAGAMSAIHLSSAMIDSAAMGAQAEMEMASAEGNARILKIKEDEAIENGKKSVAAHQKKTSQMKGTQKAALAASGVSTEYGSAAQLQEETDLLAIEDESRIRNSAMLEAWGYKTQSTNILMQAKFTSDALKKKAQATLIGGALKAGAVAAEGYGKMKAPAKQDSSIPSGGKVISGYSRNEDNGNTA